MLRQPKYLDNNATTRVDPRVLDQMAPYLGDRFGNAGSSTHPYGWEAADAVEVARDQTAQVLGVRPSQVVFVSGATEANNLAIKGICGALPDKGHIVTQNTEHKSVSESVKSVCRDGWDCTILPVDGFARVDPEAVERAIRPNTRLVTIMAANNEVGTTQPVAEIGKICRRQGIAFHTDVAQALGKVPFKPQEIGADLASISGHKIYAPKGIGVAVIRADEKNVQLRRLIDGGDQEFGYRAGTLAVALNVGFGYACEISEAELATESERLTRQRNRLFEGIAAAYPQVQLNGHPTQRLPGNLNISLPGIAIDRLMSRLEHIAVSCGSACNSHNAQPSHVLLAMGLDPDMARSAIRFGLGRFTTDDEIEETIEDFQFAIRTLQAA